MKGSEGSVFKRIGRAHNLYTRVCVFWLQGKCNRNPCKYLHTAPSSPYPQQSLSRISRQSTRPTSTWVNPNSKGPKRGISSANEKGSVSPANEKVSVSPVNEKVSVSSANEEGSVSPANEKVSGHDVRSVTQERLAITRTTEFQGEDNQKPKIKPCKSLVDDSCVHGDKRNDLHAQPSGNGFSMLAKLDGHSMAITGIALPSDSSQLFSGSKDKSVRMWDCHSGQCAGVVQFDHEIGCLVSEGPYVFFGLPNVIKAWNTQTKMMHELTASFGQVYSITVHENMLFAGTEDGTILVWKFSSADAVPELVASLKGHSLAVFSLLVSADRLYSASGDKTLRVWDLKTLQCLQTLHGHAGAVMSVLCWESYLISGSLDNTIKVWAATESGNMEVIYEHKEETGILSFCGIRDAEGKPILICSCKDNIIRLYDLPSFSDRGRIVTNGEAPSLRATDGGLLFIGDRNGLLCVWKLLQ
ncbi:unnamed protein product [Cuscuta campestris]|uniref:C3H1-type domain-containing protein n=1 Tax=Cuscuta campestris TaxID=132261 RepID=A0A484MB27_9ASTE|nr:unnamed protein product [Cuscuta campestris]